MDRNQLLVSLPTGSHHPHGQYWGFLECLSQLWGPRKRQSEGSFPTAVRSLESRACSVGPRKTQDSGSHKACYRASLRIPSLAQDDINPLLFPRVPHHSTLPNPSVFKSPTTSPMDCLPYIASLQDWHATGAWLLRVGQQIGSLRPDCVV